VNWLLEANFKRRDFSECRWVVYANAER